MYGTLFSSQKIGTCAITCVVEVAVAAVVVGMEVAVAVAVAVAAARRGGGLMAAGAGQRLTRRWAEGGGAAQRVTRRRPSAARTRRGLCPRLCSLALSGQPAGSCRGAAAQPA